MIATKSLVPFGLIVGSLVHGAPAEAVINIQVDQVGADVVVRGSGRANLQALAFNQLDTAFQNVLTDVQIFAGPSPFSAGRVDLYTGILTGPTTISTIPLLVEEPDSSASTGDLFGILADLYKVVLPEGYVSNTDLAGITTYRNHTISGLGLTPGLAAWTWGDVVSGTFDSINLIVSSNPVSVAVPGPLPLAGAAITLSLSRKIRRRLTAMTKP